MFQDVAAAGVHAPDNFHHDKSNRGSQVSPPTKWPMVCAPIEVPNEYSWA